MATYSERIELKEEILPNQVIQLRTATVVLKDGEEIGRQYHREVFSPGDDVTSAPQEVKDIAGALWTAGVILAYRSSLDTADIKLDPAVSTADIELDSDPQVEAEDTTD